MHDSPRIVYKPRVSSILLTSTCQPASLGYHHPPRTGTDCPRGSECLPISEKFVTPSSSGLRLIMVTMRALPTLMLRIWPIRALGISILRGRPPLTIPVAVLIRTMSVRVAIIIVVMVMPVGKGIRPLLPIPVAVLIGTMSVRVAIIVVMMMVMMVMIPIGKGSGCGQRYAAPEEKGHEGFLEESYHTIFLAVISLLFTNTGPRPSSCCPAPQKTTPNSHFPPNENPQYFKDFIYRVCQTQQ